MSVAIAEARVTVQDVTHRPYFTVAIFACRLCFVAIVLTRIDMDKKEEGGYGRGAVAGGREGGGVLSVKWRECAFVVGNHRGDSQHGGCLL